MKNNANVVSLKNKKSSGNSNKKELSRLIVANLDYEPSIAEFLKNCEDYGIVFINGETGTGKSYMSKNLLPDATLPTPEQLVECQDIPAMFGDRDVIIDGLCYFDNDKVFECITAIVTSGKNIIITADSADRELFERLLFRMPPGVSAMVNNLRGNDYSQNAG